MHVFDVGNAGEIDLMWSADGEMLASTSDDGISIWKVDTGELIYVLAGHRDFYARIGILGWWADESRLASIGFYDDTVRIWNVTAQRELNKIQAGILESVLAEYW